jgi:hypothetical protein
VRVTVLIPVTILALLVPIARAGSTSTDTQDQAASLVAQAQLLVDQQHPVCVQKAPPLELPVASHARPQPGLLDSLAVLRAPATRADRAAAPRLSASFEEDDSRVYVDYVRIVHSSDRHEFAILAARTPLHSQIPPAFCATDVDRGAASLDHSQSAAVRNAVLMVEQNNASSRRAMIEASRYDGAWLEDYSTEGTSSGGPYPTVRDRGVFFLDGSGADREAIDGIIPDGVTKVTVSIPRTTRLNGQRVTNKFTFSRTVTVADNVIHLLLHRSVTGIVFCRITWRDAAGRTVASFVTFVTELGGRGV